MHDGPVYNFLKVLKKLFFDQNTFVLAYDFTEIRHFAAKTDRNSVFLGYGPHILDH
jgi:hypothetical protein